jgi:glutamine synthetase
MNLAQLKAAVARKEIDTVIVAFPDVFGRLMGKRLTARHFIDSVAEKGTHACNYLLTVNMEMEPLAGFASASWEQGYGDFEMRPDLGTLRRLPWQGGTALVLCDLFRHGGTAVAEAPRTMLRGQLDRLAKMGLSCKAAGELEFFLFNQTYHSAFAGHYNALEPSSDYRIDYHTMQPGLNEPLFRAVRNGMEEAGVRIESSKGEWGLGQHEVNFEYGEALEMADAHALFKQGAKEIAAQNGKCLTFMAKRSALEVGSSCHVHMSLWEKEENIFWDATKKEGSTRFRQFLGGLLKYSTEACYLFAPTINSYKRYQPGSWAPTRMAWSMDNRTVGFRVVGEGQSFRIENRMPGADANPYLAFAAMIAAGLAGMEEGLDCGEAYKGNAYTDKSLPALAGSLRDAADKLDGSKWARSAFGDAVINFYAHTARCEVQAFQDTVTDWEKIRYFERI